MKVDKTPQPTAIEPVKTDRNAAKGSARAGPGPDAPSGDVVSLSSESRDLQRLGATLAAEPAFDADKVAAVKSAIEGGTFRIDAGKVADGLIASVREVLANKVSA